jgi:alpha-tubulin suppressor-like RCC1 family protein
MQTLRSGLIGGWILCLASCPAAHAANPTVGIDRSGNSLVLRFTGTLQSANTPGGRYSTVDGATSPYVIPLDEAGTQFWRAMLPVAPPSIVLAGGGHHTLVVTADGVLRSWGANYNGQLGLNYFNSTAPYGIALPQPVPGESTWRWAATGSDHSMALRSDGSLWAWGFNGYGQLGDGTETGTSQPKRIGTNITWQTVATGGRRTVAVRSDGTMWSWGDNREGQNGDGTWDYLWPFGPRHGTGSPVQVGTNADWKSVAVGPIHAFAFRTDGSLWAWGGQNASGELGITGRSTLTPQPVVSPVAWATVSAGAQHSVALAVDGSLWGWGSNGDGQAGLGTNRAASTPQPIAPGATWLAVSAGAFHTVALRSDGTLWGCGRNDSGQLGLASPAIIRTLRPIETESTWCAVVAGERHTLALRSDRSLWSWGANDYGQLGNGTFLGTSQPQQIAIGTNW